MMIPWPISPLPDLAECRKVARWRNHPRLGGKWGASWQAWSTVPDDQLLRLIVATWIHRDIPFAGRGFSGQPWMSSARSYAAEYTLPGVQMNFGYAIDALLHFLLLAAVAGDDLGVSGAPVLRFAGLVQPWPAGDLWDYFSIGYQSTGFAPGKPFGPINTAAWIADGRETQVALTVSPSLVLQGIRDGTGPFSALASVDSVPFVKFGSSAEVGTGPGQIAPW